MNKKLKEIIAPVRCGWHGITAIVLGLGIASVGISLHDAGTIVMSSTIPISIGTSYFIDSYESFRKTCQNIEKYGGLDETSVNNHSLQYCNRQGARTAADLYGLVEQFDNYKKNKVQKAKWMPHI